MEHSESFVRQAKAWEEGNHDIMLKFPKRGDRKSCPDSGWNVSDPLWERNNQAQRRYSKVKATKPEKTRVGSLSE